MLDGRPRDACRRATRPTASRAAPEPARSRRMTPVAGRQGGDADDRADAARTPRGRRQGRGARRPGAGGLRGAQAQASTRSCARPGSGDEGLHDRLAPRPRRSACSPTSSSSTPAAPSIKRRRAPDCSTRSATIVAERGQAPRGGRGPHRRPPDRHVAVPVQLAAVRRPRGRRRAAPDRRRRRRQAACRSAATPHAAARRRQHDRAPSRARNRRVEIVLTRLHGATPSQGGDTP